MSANLFGIFPSKLPQNRHPERSASQVYRVTPRSMARSRRACPERSRRNPEDAYLGYAVRSFSTIEARGKVALRPMAASACATLGAMKTFAKPSLGKQQLKGWRREKKLNLIRTIDPEFKKTLHRAGDGR
jgi:hypothetical protein